MMNFTKVKNKTDVTQNLIGYCNKLYANIDEALHYKLQLSYGKEINTVNPFDVKRILLETEYTNDTQKLIKLILACLVNTNKKYATLDYTSLVSTLFFLKSMLKNKNFCKEFDHDELLKNISHSSRRVNKEALNRCVDKCISNHLIKNILNECYSMTDITGNIYIDKNINEFNVIECVNGYSFKLYPIPEFVTMSQIKYFNATNCKVMLIDGMIEKVSEIDNILRKAHQSLTPIFIFARGFSEETIATLATNWVRNTLKVIPMHVGFNNTHNINLLNDLGSVCNSDVTSSIKGELISTILYENLPTVDSIILDYQGIIIKNQKTTHKVLNQIAHLNLLKEEHVSNENLNLLNSRIQNLSNKHINIKFNKNISENKGQLIDQLSMGIKLIRDISKHGLINFENLKSKINAEMFIFLKSRGFDYMPSNCVIEGLKMGFIHAKLLSNSPIFITFDK